MKEVDVSSLEHTSWRCQYHVVFAPKYRRMEIYGKIKEDIGIILRKLCQQVDTVGRNKKAIKAYIQNQLEEDKMSDQISIKEFIDPFTGSKNPKAQIKPLKGLRPQWALIGPQLTDTTVAGNRLARRWAAAAPCEILSVNGV